MKEDSQRAPLLRTKKISIHSNLLRSEEGLLGNGRFRRAKIMPRPCKGLSSNWSSVIAAPFWCVMTNGAITSLVSVSPGCMFLIGNVHSLSHIRPIQWRTREEVFQTVQVKEFSRPLRTTFLPARVRGLINPCKRKSETLFILLI